MNLNIGCSLTLNPRPPAACTLAPTPTAATRKAFRPAKLVDYQVTHSMSPKKVEIFKSLEPWVDANILVHLKPVETSWQPQDFLPDPASPGFYDQLQDLRERSSQLSDDYFIVLVGDMVTEESVPTYMTVFNTLDGTKDETCCSPSPWALWNRGWIAEENRHGDLLSKYLYLTGRVDMVSIHKTIQYVLGSGMDFQWENNPYVGFMYTSFQEMAAFTSHGNTARLAKDQGDMHLAKLCGTIASDEKRHETAYLKVMAKLFEVDPDTSMLAFADMMKKRIYMTVKLMHDGQDDNLYDHFSAVAQRIGSFTSRDYAEIVESLVKRWKIDKITTGLSGEGRRAQEYLCGLAPRLMKLDEKARDKAKKTKPNYVPFSWIFNKEVRI